MPQNHLQLFVGTWCYSHAVTYKNWNTVGVMLDQTGGSINRCFILDCSSSGWRCSPSLCPLRWEYGDRGPHAGEDRRRCQSSCRGHRDPRQCVGGCWWVHGRPLQDQQTGFLIFVIYPQVPLLLYLVIFMTILLICYVCTVASIILVSAYWESRM